MKKSVIVLRLLTCVLFFLIGLSSCMDNENDIDDFNVVTTGYVLQEQINSKNVFTPYFFITSTSEQHELSAVEIYGENKLKVERYGTNPYTFVSTDENKFDSLSSISGKYVILSSSKNGNSITQEISYDFFESDTISNIVLDTLYYNGSEIVAKIEKVTNAATLGFILAPYNEGSQPYRDDYYYHVAWFAPAFTDNVQQFSINLDSSSAFDADYLYVKVFVRSEKNLYRESKGKNIKKAAQKFIED